jgi:hypothetical protein
MAKPAAMRVVSRELHHRRERRRGERGDRAHQAQGLLTLRVPQFRSDERRPRGGSQANASTRLDGVQGFFCGDGRIYGLRDGLDSLIRLRQQPREQFSPPALTGLVIWLRRREACPAAALRRSASNPPPSAAPRGVRTASCGWPFGRVTGSIPVRPQQVQWVSSYAAQASK